MRDFISLSLIAHWFAGAVRLVVFDLTEGWLNLLQLARSMVMGGIPFIIQVRRTRQTFRVVSAGDVWTINEVIVRNEYHWDKVQAPPDASVIDVGGNIGAFAVWAGRRYPLGAIYCYEPFPDNHVLLLDNLARNGVNHVRTFQLAVWSKCSTLAMDTTLPFACMYSAGEPGSSDDTRLRVEAISLDSIFETHHLTRCDILKLDCEGAEYEILMNALPTTLRRVRFILAEYHDNRVAQTHAELVSYLNLHGFYVEIRPSRALKDVGHLFAMNLLVAHNMAQPAVVAG